MFMRDTRFASKRPFDPTTKNVLIVIEGNRVIMSRCRVKGEVQISLVNSRTFPSAMARDTDCRMIFVPLCGLLC